MKKVLIFGKDGQLGNDLVKVFKQDYLVASLGRQDLDIANAKLTEEFIIKEQPYCVLNAAAYNKVEAAETETEEAFKVNALAVYNLAKASKKAGAIFFHFSTDYVFDGLKDSFSETDIPNPLNVYGLSKLAGEQLVKIAAPSFYIVRTCALFGAKQGGQKMNFVDSIVAKAKAGEALNVVNNLFTSPTYSLDLAQKTKELLEAQPAFGIYHLSSSGSCSWYEFALEILKQAGIKARVVPVEADFSTSFAKRPKFGILKNSRLIEAGLSPMPDWRDSLKKYLAEKY